jgi:hypothetical protein
MRTQWRLCGTRRIGAGGRSPGSPRPTGTFSSAPGLGDAAATAAVIGERPMHSIIYLVGLIVVILAILSFFGLR